MTYINRESLLRLIDSKPHTPITGREERLINAFISTVKNFPAADVIDREVYRGKMNHLRSRCFEGAERFFDNKQYGLLCIVTEDRVRKSGRWLELDDCMTVCSECNSLGCGSQYCPVCGAYMTNAEEING